MITILITPKKESLENPVFSRLLDGDEGN